MPSQPDDSAALAIQTPAINDRSLAAGLAYAMGGRVSGISFDAATGLISQTGPLDLVGPAEAPKDDPAMAQLINNTGDDGGASSG